MIARLVRSADFERVLRTRTRVNSLHFAVHHVADRPGTPAKPARKAVPGELSTGELRIEVPPVDDSGPAVVSLPVDAVWLGTVVPKRHARRSVTRSLLKRQIRHAVTTHAASLAAGLWVVRLRAPFDRSRFVSAASDELRRVAREELDSLIGSAARRVAVGA
jgi:ribonuclease P protein component